MTKQQIEYRLEESLLNLELLESYLRTKIILGQFEEISKNKHFTDLLKNIAWNLDHIQGKETIEH